MPDPFAPDLSERPFSMTLEHRMKAAAGDIYAAWTEGFDKWFAQPGELIMHPRREASFSFTTVTIGVDTLTMVDS